MGSEETPRPKCTDEQWCSTLSKYVQMGSVKGFRSLSYSNATSDKFTHRIAYYATAKRKGGHVLNFCPFCGAFIQGRPGVQSRPEGFPALEDKSDAE